MKNEAPLSTVSIYWIVNACRIQHSEWNPSQRNRESNFMGRKIVKSAQCARCSTLWARATTWARDFSLSRELTITKKPSQNHALLLRTYIASSARLTPAIKIAANHIFFPLLSQVLLQLIFALHIVITSTTNHSTEWIKLHIGREQLQHHFARIKTEKRLPMNFTRHRECNTCFEMWRGIVPMKSIQLSRFRNFIVSSVINQLFTSLVNKTRMRTDCCCHRHYIPPQPSSLNPPILKFNQNKLRVTIEMIEYSVKRDEITNWIEWRFGMIEAHCIFSSWKTRKRNSGMTMSPSTRVWWLNECIRWKTKAIKDFKPFLYFQFINIFQQAMQRNSESISMRKTTIIDNSQWAWARCIRCARYGFVC